MFRTMYLLFRETAKYYSKIVNFLYPPVFHAPVEDDLSDFVTMFGT